jgi:hypothetical protein
MEKGQVIKTTNGIKIGDWIYLKENTGFFYKGYVTRILGQTELSMFCIGYWDKKKKYLTEYKEYGRVSTNTYSYQVLKEKENLIMHHIEDKRHLIDLALMTGDKDWFGELVN